MEYTTNLPSQVQVVFSLRDENGHAIVRPAEQVEQGARVYERGPGTDGWAEIDYTETSFFVKTGENIDLEVVFVLDFTNSMAAARLRDGRNGIEAMLDAFEASLAVLPSAHRVGVVEFHDRNVSPSVLSPLTTNRQAVLGAARRFLSSRFDSGASRVWDALVTGSGLFSSRAENPRTARALIFLSDGRDTSSEFSRERAADYASARGVQLYAVGVGDVFQAGQLRDAARSTGGAYYPAGDIDLLQEQMQLLVDDLRGQYQLTYITLRRTGEYRAAIEVEIEGVDNSTVFGPFDVAGFYGPDNQGVVEFDPPSLDRTNRRATAFMRALHVPRNIDRIRFRAQTSKQLKVELVPSEDGGLLEGWNLSGPGAGGWYEASSGTPLEFGSLGLMFKLTISGVTEKGLEVPIEFDNSMYAGSKTLGDSMYLVIGDFVPAGRIVFHSDRDGDDEIYTMNADGSGVRQLTRNSDDDGLPDWSPDGRRIVFDSDRDGDAEIYVMNADGSGVRQLTDNSSSDWWPNWSPDGRRIVFVSHRDGDWEIYVMNADGSRVRQLTDNSSGDSSASWSPDGRRIVFYSNRDGDWEIYVMNADGSRVRQLTDNSSPDWGPSWSPDGRRIAFNSSRDGGDEIYVMNADGSGVRQLTHNNDGDYRPHWSPDGRRIVFHSNRDDPDPDDDTRIWNIYRMNSDGSGQTRLTDDEAFTCCPKWSPAASAAPAASTQSVTATPVVPAGPADDHGDSGSDATGITEGSATDGDLGTAGDVDYFYFETQQGRWYTIQTSLGTLADSIITLYDASGSRIDGNDNIGETTRASGLEWPAPSSATYYVKVEGADGKTGTYRLSLAERQPHSNPKVKAWFRAFYVIRTDLDEFGDHDSECATQLGANYRLADWNDLIDYVALGGSLAELIEGLNWKDENTADVGVRSPRVSHDGEEIWGGGRRHYLVARHDHSPTEGFHVHDQIGTYHLTLGSWYGEGADVLCYEVAVAATAASRIMFVSDRAGDDDVYVMNADGSNVASLTDDAADDTAPVLSPDGRRIVFVSDRDGHDSEIFVMNYDGSNETRLTRNSADDKDPSWSPDGRRIVFWSNRDGNADIYVMNADGSGEARLTDDEESDMQPSWSPNGRSIAFTSNRDGNFNVYVMKADGSEATRLTGDAADEVSPSWSPFGRRIAFASRKGGNWEIYTMKADGSEVTRLTDNTATDGKPSWSPDGRRIVFWSNRDGNAEIYVMDADGSNVTRLTDNEASDYGPSW